MADKQTYPYIPETAWWQLRSQFKKTIPNTIGIGYIQSLLSITSKSAANHIISALKQLGIIEEDGKPSPLANDWRNDEKYKELCNKILVKIYPNELLDLFPDGESESSKIRQWFMNTNSVGQNAAYKLASTFQLLQNGQIKQNNEGSKVSKPKQILPKKVPSAVASPPPALINTFQDHVDDKSHAKLPTMHIDLQIHISPESSIEQIDGIFSSIAKHLYGK
jgi:hypothetical protein